MAPLCPEGETTDPQSPIFDHADSDASTTWAEFAAVMDGEQSGELCSLCIDLISRRMTHPGQKRQQNQDSLLTIEANRISNSVGLPIGVYAVADGVGGQASGEVASKLTVDAIAQKAQIEAIAPYLNSGAVPFADPTLWMIEVTNAANQLVRSCRQEMQSNMSTTLVWALVLEDVAYIANVGDSRAYVMNDSGFRQITRDHSLVGRLVADGQITAEQARVHPHRNVVYRAMGSSDQVDVDVFVEPLRIGDRLLLCSDGLSSMLSGEALWQGAMSSKSLAESCSRLVREANEAGGPDNITVILVELVVM